MYPVVFPLHILCCCYLHVTVCNSPRNVYCLHLPIMCLGCREVAWTPSITVTDKKHVEIVCKPNQEGSSGCAVCGVVTMRHVFDVQTEVEAGKFSATVDRDCILIRMPFFYPGSQRSGHSGSFIYPQEIAATASGTVPTCCRCVGGEISARVM